MKPLPLVLRERARRDVEEAVAFYLEEAGPDVAGRFIASVERLLEEMATHPEAGSPRFAQELGLPGLRARLLGDFPYIVFYLPTDALVDVWRVLHARRDIPEWMREPD